MKLKRPSMTGIVMASAIVGAGFVNMYRSWKYQQINRLEAESSMLETASGPVEYRMYGEGPAVLIVHGTPGGYDQSYAFSRLIGSEKHTFIAISRPGYLRTPLNTGATPVAQADVYAALLDALGIERAAVIGISGGGPSAIQFALRHPERCLGLVTVSGVAQRFSELELRKDWPLAKLLAVRLYSRVTNFGPFLYLLVSLARLWPDQLISAQMVHSLTMYHLRKVGYANDMEQFAIMPPYALEQIVVPTFVVHGKADDEVPFADAELLVRKIPNVRLLAIAGGTHLVFYIHASIVMPAIREFLDSLGL